jgi:hypothetical protein
MSGDSVLVVYQHLQKDARKRDGDVLRRISDLTRLLAASTWALHWNDLAFLVTVREAVTATRIRTTLRGHAKRHGISFRDLDA